eukprot:447915-Amphidinium_carterae.1
MYSEMAVKDAMNKELSQLMSKQSFKELDSRTLTPEQLQQVNKMGDHTTTIQQWHKRHQVQVCGKGFSQFIHDTDTQTFAATPSSMAMRPLPTLAIVKQFTVFTTDVANAFLNTPINEEVLVLPPKEYYHNQPHMLWRMTKALYGLSTSPKQWQEHLSTLPQRLGFTRLKSDACVFAAFAYKQSPIYIMSYFDDLLIAGDNVATHQFLLQFKQQLELKHTTQLTKTTSLEFLGKTIELQDDGPINLSFSVQYYNKILKAYNVEKYNACTTPGNKKPPFSAQPLDKEQQSMYRTAVGQLLWVSQLRVDIAFAVKELSRALQQPDNENLKNLKQLLRYIKGTIHYKPCTR